MEKLITYNNNYRRLIVYCKAECIYDITYSFCNRFLRTGDRTIDQMVQAARSGKQNIVEGCAAAAVSLKSEIKLLGVAKASMLELLVDYEDYLRVRKLRQWEPNSVEVQKMREIGKEHHDTEYYSRLIESRNDETIANIAIVLIKQVDFMLARLLDKKEKQFLAEGGMHEKMFRMRAEVRAKREDDKK